MGSSWWETHGGELCPCQAEYCRIWPWARGRAGNSRGRFHLCSLRFWAVITGGFISPNHRCAWGQARHPMLFHIITAALNLKDLNFYRNGYRYFWRHFYSITLVFLKKKKKKAARITSGFQSVVFHLFHLQTSTFFSSRGSDPCILKLKPSDNRLIFLVKFCRPFRRSQSTPETNRLQWKWLKTAIYLFFCN